MTLAPALAQALAAARHRVRAIALLSALPWLAPVLALALRPGQGAWAGLLLGLSVLLVLGLGWHSARGIGPARLTRWLDQARPDMEDSADLLLADRAALQGLEGLQRDRLEQRLRLGAMPDPRPPWPRRRLALTWTLALAASAVVALWPERPPGLAGPPAGSPTTADIASETRLLETRLEIEPPTYTGLPPRSETSLDARLPAGSTLRWRLRFEPQPSGVELVFHDGSRLPMQREGAGWAASRRVDQALLYRLVPAGAPAMAQSRLHRLDAVADQPPQVRVLAPDRSLSLLEAGQRHWPLSFEASDDHGLGAARLAITLAQGSGENISVIEQTLELRGEGDARTRRYTRRLDLGALGLAAGDDLIVRLSVSDNRAPRPQTTRSASFILRWPALPASESTGLDGLVKKTLPAYFRSQRQIIIDTEALVPLRPRLSGDDFTGRSDAIGVDQRLLRLRYGQFLGEETSDEGHAGDEHDDGAAATPGDAAAVQQQFGHSHDIAEAATLLDPETKELLRAALGEMWQAELHLRQGEPGRALPFEYRALALIKQVQQSSRIYLARVGLELPPIDESRRLTGDRKGLGRPRDPLLPATTAEALVADAWRELATLSPAGGTDNGRAEKLEALETWVLEREAQLPDALGLLAEIDALRQDANCAPCAQRLRARLWPLLPAPAPATTLRPAADGHGQAYLDALGPEPPP